LSKSPTHHFYNSRYFDAQEKKEEKELTWDDILKDDPLTGEYWKIPCYSSDSSSDNQISDIESDDNNTNINKNSKNEISFQEKEFLNKKIDSISTIKTSDSNSDFDDTSETIQFNDMSMNSSKSVKYSTFIFHKFTIINVKIGHIYYNMIIYINVFIFSMILY